jgi:hypothetical protein
MPATRREDNRRESSGNFRDNSNFGDNSMRSMSKVIVLSGLAAFAIAMVGATIWMSEPAKSDPKEPEKGNNGQTISRLGF